MGRLDLPDPRRDEDEPQSLYEHFLTLLDAIPGIRWGVEEDWNGVDPSVLQYESVLGEVTITLMLTHSPDTPTAYLTALHELGHLMTLDGVARTDPDREAAAWRWAIDHSIQTIGPDEREFILSCLGTYRSLEWESLIEELTSEDILLHAHAHTRTSY